MTTTTTNAVSTPAIKIDKAFEIGTIYQAFTCGKGYTGYKVTARTAKFVTVINLTDGTQKRCKVDLDSKKYYANGEHTVEVIRPDKKAYGIAANDIDHKAMQKVKAALVEEIANEYAVSTEAQDVAVEAEIEQATATSENESEDDDTDKYFELADELDEIGDDICNTKDILERKIANGAPQTEIKSLESYIDEREDEYRALHKRIYGVEPQVDKQSLSD